MGECCHYDEGYEEGLNAAETGGIGDFLCAQIDELLERCHRALYEADPLSLLAADCEAMQKEIRDLLKPKEQAA